MSSAARPPRPVPGVMVRPGATRNPINRCIRTHAPRHHAAYSSEWSAGGLRSFAWKDHGFAASSSSMPSNT
eukprot:scaffold1141_cov369-Prasinococcus_capsulatus_cf.AAC.10